jgi:membrane-associated phospholipid phosphatase
VATERARLALAAALASLLGFAITASLALHQFALWSADERLLASLSAHDAGKTGRLAHLLSHLGEPLPQVLLLAIAVAIGLRRGRRSWALAAVLVVAGADLTTQGLKRALLDHRLGEIGRLYPAGEHTFPSGHTTTMVALTFAFLFVVPARLRLPAALLGAALTALVAGSMVVLHKHWPSDVLGGAFVGATWGFAAVVVLEGLPARSGPARDQGAAVARR